MAVVSNERTRVNLSRRDLLSGLGTALLSLKAQAYAPIRVAARMVREFPHSRLVSAAPSGGLLCLEDWVDRAYPLRVIDVSSGSTLYSGKFQSRVLSAEFTVDSKGIFVRLPPAARSDTAWEGIVDVATGKRNERVYQAYASEYWEQVIPTIDQTLLVCHSRLSTGRFEWFARSEFTSGKDIVRKEVDAGDRASKPRSDVAVSDDRETMIYFSDDNVVCRRTRDLEVLWTREMEPGLRACPLTISPSGNYVAAVVSKGISKGQFERYTTLYAVVYDGKTGTELARLDIAGSNSIAISPDGRLLARMTTEPGVKGEVILTAHIHELPSGTKVESFVHDHVEDGRRQFLQASAGASFTADGKYVITSGMVTKIWRLES